MDEVLRRLGEDDRDVVTATGQRRAQVVRGSLAPAAIGGPGRIVAREENPHRRPPAVSRSVPPDRPVVYDGLVSTQRRALTSLILEQRSLYAIGSTFVAIGLAAALSYPLLIKRLIDDGVLAGNMTRVNELALLLLVLLAAEGVATVIRDYYFNLAAERLTARLRQRVFDHLLRQEIAFFDSRNVGELTARLWDDVTVVGRVIGVIGTVLLIYTSPLLSVLLVLAVPPIALTAWFLGGRVKTRSTQTQQAYAEAGIVAEESLGGIRTVRAFAQEPAARARY